MHYITTLISISNLQLTLYNNRNKKTHKTTMNAKTLSRLEDVRISAINPLISPAILQEDYPIPAEVAQWIAEKREEVERVVDGKDDRLLVVVGPCSIHDSDAAIDYGMRYYCYEYLIICFF